MRHIAPALLLAGSLFAADPIVSAFKPRYETAKKNFVESAAAMPASAMEYKLTPEQRSFGGWLSHTAGMNFNTCASLAGKPAPANDSAKAKTKEEIQTVLKASFEYCDQVIGTLTDAQAVSELTVGKRKVVPVDLMFGYIANLNAHYGNMVGYMRTKGVVPPSTARAAAQHKH